MASYAPIDIDSINWDQYLSAQIGGQSDRYFVGQRYMRGYVVLGTIGKFLLPIAKNLASTVGSEGVQAGTKILKDVTEGKDFTEALKEHSKKGFENLQEKIKQCGKGKTRTSRKTTSRTNDSWPSYKNVSYKKTKTVHKRRKPDQLDIF